MTSSGICRKEESILRWYTAQLTQSGHGIYIEQLFVGCVCYADDIALLSASCYGLQKLVDMHYAVHMGY